MLHLHQHPHEHSLEEQNSLCIYLGTAWPPDNGIVGGLRACQVDAADSRVVAQVLALLATTIHKGQVPLIHKWLERFPAMNTHQVNNNRPAPISLAPYAVIAAVATKT